MELAGPAARLSHSASRGAGIRPRAPAPLCSEPRGGLGSPEHPHKSGNRRLGSAFISFPREVQKWLLFVRTVKAKASSQRHLVEGPSHHPVIGAGSLSFTHPEAIDLDRIPLPCVPGTGEGTGKEPVISLPRGAPSLVGKIG